MLYPILAAAVIGFLTSPSWAGVAYSGTPKKVPPQKLTKIQRKNEQGEVAWSGEGILATRDRRIALIGTANRFPDQKYGLAIDPAAKFAADQPIVLQIFGGKSKTEAIDQLFGALGSSAFGYIYCLDDSTFQHEPGLREAEIVSRKVPKLVRNRDCPDGYQTIIRKNELERYLSQGLLKIQWIPGQAPEAD